MGDIDGIRDRHRQALNLFREEWKQDSIIFDLLTAIVLFIPRQDCSAQDHLNRQHFAYIRLLNRYLNVKYPQEDVAKESFELLMYNIQEVKLICDDIWPKFGHHFREGLLSSPMFLELFQQNNLLFNKS